jgi:SAM-dependent methyltransferase
MTIPAEGGRTCETCNAQCFERTQKGRVSITEPWAQVMGFVDCPNCDRFCYDHAIFDVDETALSNVAEVQRRYWLDKAAEKKAGSDSYDTAFEVVGYRYVREALERAIIGRRRMRIVDFGSGPGATITYLARQFPDTSFSYVGFEPNADFAERAKAIAASSPVDVSIRTEDAVAVLGLDRPWGDEPVDLFLALGVLCYVLPPLTKRLFASLEGVAERIMVRDYLGNCDRDSETAAILYHKHFPMFAHPYRKYLASAGLDITRVSPSIGGPYDGRNWGVLEAERRR